MRLLPPPESIKLNLPVNELVQDLNQIKIAFPIAQRRPHYGGWTLQSTNGSYQDGWGMELVPFNGPHNLSPSWTPLSEDEKSLKDAQSFSQLSDACTETFKKVIQKLENLGLHPRRTRIIYLAPGSTLQWHQDGLPEHYQVRLHVPLITNPDCYFETEVGRYHMPADGNSYLVHINRFHRAKNDGMTGRYHLVSYVWDTQHASQHHRYNSIENLGETAHGTNTWFKL